MKAFNKGNFALLWFPLFIVFSIHNAEEYFGNMPAWGEKHFSFLSGAGMYQQLFGVALVFLVILLLFIAYLNKQNYKMTRQLMKFFTLFMIGNCFWHMGTSFLSKSISPGLLSALVLGLPTYVYCFYLLMRFDRSIKRSLAD